MPTKSKCCDSPITAKCMKCEKMCEVVEYQTSTWSAHYGFPYHITVGHLWWKKRVPNGWEDRGQAEKRTENRYRTHSECATRLHVGFDDEGSFLYCPKCLVKIKP